ncbi:hypothetical protein E2C01_094230 [Portunus trituberculatus]|uniref:Uncharacterized protein n=1 Tax=Portunus trituberculatus TaxID=210409 RepID=A0A5B7JWC1_PORTR|nr:hypothetical protein [Portunus trituberculatus]
MSRPFAQQPERASAKARSDSHKHEAPCFCFPRKPAKRGGLLENLLGASTFLRRKHQEKHT